MTLEPPIPHEVDCLVLGGGITGAGVAREAALRGLRVLLIDCEDFASGTSHLTSKLVHGGLRYLDQGYIRLAFQGVRERNRLVSTLAPHLVHPIRFLIPYDRRRSVNFLATAVGINAYDLMGAYQSVPRSRAMFEGAMRAVCPLLRPHPFGVAFWDAQTHDARLVMAVLRTAERHGGLIRNYTALSSAEFRDGVWTLGLRCSDTGAALQVRARCVVNATGPWAPRTAELLGQPAAPMRWIKGAHILLRRPADYGDCAVVIRSVRDGRPLWVVPWEARLMVGSTESAYDGDLRRVRADAQDVQDLFESFAAYFPQAALTRADIRMTFAGVRPIIDQAARDANHMSREHRVEVDAGRALITVMGGKLTTFRLMAESAVDAAFGVIGAAETVGGARRARREPLWPAALNGDGAAMAVQPGMAGPSSDLQPSASSSSSMRWLMLYGRDGEALAASAGWGEEGEALFGPLPYTLAELRYLVRSEHVHGLLDLLKRRTAVYFLADDLDAGVLGRLCRVLATETGWDAARQQREIADVLAERAADLAALSGSAEAPRRTGLAACA